MAGNLVTPWLHALSARFGAPHDLFAGMPVDLIGRTEFQESGLYLWRQALSPELAAKLTQKISPVMNDLFQVKRSKKSTDMTTYKSFQATSTAPCSCKYNYCSRSKHVLYHKGDTTSVLQPASVTMLLEDVFMTLEEWGDGEYPMIRTPCDSAGARKPRDFNLIVVNEYNFNEEPDSFLPWHDDQMNQSVRNEEDEVLTPVITISLGEPAVFAVMPSKSAPQFFTEMCGGWHSRKWSTAKSKIRGRFAFLLHHGDILLTTGKFDKSFMHKTWKRDIKTLQSIELLKQEARSKNYTFINFPDDQTRLNNDAFKFGRRWDITGRHLRYHDLPCPLNVLQQLNADTMIGTGGSDSLPRRFWKRKHEEVDHFDTGRVWMESDGDTPSPSDMEDVIEIMELPLARRTELVL